MPDIWGREIEDYDHLRAMGPQAQDFLRRRAAARNQPVHNFNTGRLRVETNAQAFAYITENTQAVDSMIYEIMYTQHRLPEMVPMNTSIPEGAQTWAYRVVDGTGLGTWIDNDGTALPSATASQRLVPYLLGYAGIAARWTVDDLRVAQHAGFGLSDMTMRHAVEGAMDHMEMVGFSGDSARGLEGLTNLSTAAAPTGSQVKLTTAAANQDFVSLQATPSEIVEDLQGYVEDMITSTQEVLGGRIRSPLNVYLPIDKAGIVLHTRLSDVSMTVWDYFAMNNLWTHYTGQQPRLRILKELKNAAVSGTNDRMVLAVFDPMVFEMGVPISPRARETQMNGLEVSVPFEYKFSGLQVKIPGGIQYVDNI